LFMNDKRNIDIVRYQVPVESKHVLALSDAIVKESTKGKHCADRNAFMDKELFKICSMYTLKIYCVSSNNISAVHFAAFPTTSGHTSVCPPALSNISRSLGSHKS